MLRVLPPRFELDLQQVRLQGFLVLFLFFRGWLNEEHRYSTRFAAKSKNKLRIFMLPVLLFVLICVNNYRIVVVELRSNWSKYNST